MNIDLSKASFELENKIIQKRDELEAKKKKIEELKGKLTNVSLLNNFRFCKIKKVCLKS